MIKHGISSFICFLVDSVIDFQFSDEYSAIRETANQYLVNYGVSENLEEITDANLIFVFDKQLLNTDIRFIYCDSIDTVVQYSTHTQIQYNSHIYSANDLMSILCKLNDCAEFSLQSIIEGDACDEHFKLKQLIFSTYNEEYLVNIDRELTPDELNSLYLSLNKAWVYDIKKETPIYWRLFNEPILLHDIKTLFVVDNPSNNANTLETLCSIYLNTQITELKPRYILQIKELLYPQHSNTYLTFLQQYFLSSQMECYGIRWDNEFSNKLDSIYSGIKGKLLTQLTETLGLKQPINVNTFYSIFRCKEVEYIATLNWIESQCIYHNIYLKYSKILATKDLSSVYVEINKDTYFASKLSQSMPRYELLYQSLSHDNLSFFYQSYKKYYHGFDVDNENTWSDSFKLLFYVKMFKKIDKLTTIINGSIGKSSVRQAIDRFDKPPIRLTSTGLNSDCNVVKTSFTPCSTETRRWQSGFHTLPSSTELRRCYIPPKGMLFCHFDYSQNELRILAGLANDMVLTSAFKNGLDIHKFIAASIYEKPIEDVTSNERNLAKLASFSLVYGKTIDNFARDFLQGDVLKATELFNQFYKKFPKTHQYILDMQSYAIERKAIYSIFGDKIYPSGSTEELKRKYVNYRIQNSASQLAATNLFKLNQALFKKKIAHQIVSFIHDASDICFDKSCAVGLLDTMYETLSLTHKDVEVVLDIDVKIGINLYDLVSFKKIAGNRYAIESTEYALNQLLQLISYQEINIAECYSKRDSYDRIFATKSSYSLSFGKQVNWIKGEILV